mmetsp:Transcript_30049/g.34767  ORF Transcript_30049/g.34767 Transcript_30049/m.34767 type:complete len:91 (-) Transcript_30049:451-723(-)
MKSMTKCTLINHSLLLLSRAKIPSRLLLNASYVIEYTTPQYLIDNIIFFVILTTFNKALSLVFFSLMKTLSFGSLLSFQFLLNSNLLFVI